MKEQAEELLQKSQIISSKISYSSKVPSPKDIYTKTTAPQQYCNSLGRKPMAMK